MSRAGRSSTYLFDLASAKLEPLAKSAQYNDVAPAWSPDGKQIAFVRTQERAVDMDGKMDIQLVEARAGAQPRPLLRVWAPNFQHLAWSPDGKLLAFLQGLAPKYSMYMHDELWVVPGTGGAPRALTDKLDRWIYSYSFAADNKSMLLLIEDDGNNYPARLELSDNSIDRLVTRPIVTYGQSSAGKRTAVTASDET